MIASPAEWIDRVLGPALTPLAAVLGASAAAAAVLAAALALWRAWLAFGAWRYGWEEALVVRCLTCGAIAADPRRPVCAGGHPVRFPPGARLRASVRQSLRPWRGGFAILQTAACVLLAAAALSAWILTGAGARRLAAAALLGALASLATSATALAALAAMAPGARGIGSRLALAGLAAALLVPAAALSLLSSAMDSPEARIVGSVWSTPTAVYVEGHRGEARRAGPAASAAVARIIEVRLPGAGPLWQGLSEILAGDTATRWPGERGLPARLLALLASPEASPVAFVREKRVPLDLPVNQKVWVVRRGERISFDPEMPGDLPATSR